MAIESYPESETGVEQKFSVKSDVWSFGVVVYELFSEGDDPPYISIDNLREGERLAKPEKATEKM